MTVVGAAFSSEIAAQAAEREVVEQLALDPRSIDRAPLGAVGRRSDGRIIVAARISRQALPEAISILVRHGGEIVTGMSAPGATGGIRVEAETRART
jgi:hypothetical protein